MGWISIHIHTSSCAFLYALYKTKSQLVVLGKEKNLTKILQKVYSKNKLIFSGEKKNSNKTYPRSSTPKSVRQSQAFQKSFWCRQQYNIKQKSRRAEIQFRKTCEYRSHTEFNFQHSSQKQGQLQYSQKSSHTIPQ